MKTLHPWLLSLLVAILALPLWGQKEGSYRDLATPRVRSEKLSTPEHLKNYVVEGKLRLTLRDAVVLTLENNSLIRVQETQIDFSKFALLAAHSPFDPSVGGSYNVNSSTFPPSTALQGTGTAAVNNTTQVAQLSYSETFWTGTNVQASFNSNNSQTNSNFSFLNPSISSALNLQFT